MAGANPDRKNTQARLLEAGRVVFGKKGFQRATVAEICQLAGANIAAVNYHFGSKATLYAEAWRYSFQQSLKAYPPDGGAGPDRPPQERLRARIHAMLARIMDPESHEFEIVRHEMGNPTGLLREPMRQMIGPLRQAMLEVVRELLGEAADERLAHLCLMSILGQCLHVVHREWHRRHFGHQGRAIGPPPDPWDQSPEQLADHITRFSLAGLAGLRRQAAGGNAEEHGG